MLFQPLASSRSVRWRPETGEGLEHLTIEPSEGGYRVRSAVVGSLDGRAFGAFYSAVIDAGWRTLSLRIESSEGHRIALSSPEPGRWIDEDGFERVELHGCIDIDLSATPFTNTLPIRRLGLTRVEGEVSLRMLYVPFDTFEPFAHVQSYRALEDGRLYRFETGDRSFAADLPLDENGLVLDYPKLFKRL